MRYLIAILFFSISCLGQGIPKQQILPDAITMPKFPGDENSFRKLFSHLFPYPDVDFENNYTATVDFLMIINENGHVSELRVRKDSGAYYGLGSASLQTVKRIDQLRAWQPALKNGKPTKVWCNILVHFSKLPNMTELEPTLEFRFSEYIEKEEIKIPTNVLPCGNGGNK